jgi:CheY-like chemotaxis protein
LAKGYWRAGQGDLLRRGGEQDLAQRLILIGFEPLLHELLAQRLGDEFDLVGTALSAADAIAVARTHQADAILVDADAAGDHPDDLIAKLSLLNRAPIVALAATAGAGKADMAALLAAGAHAVLPKPAGPLPLDLEGGLGERMVRLLRQAAPA